MYPKKRKNDNNNSDDINGKFLMHKPFKEIEDDNPRQFDQVLCRSVNVKNAKFDWTRTTMSSSLLLIPLRILGPTLLSPGDFGHYFL